MVKEDRSSRAAFFAVRQLRRKTVKRAGATPCVTPSASRRVTRAEGRLCPPVPNTAVI